MAFDVALDELVEDVQIDIREELRGQIADGQCHAWLCKAHTFGMVYVVPVVKVAYDVAVFHRVEHNNLLREPQNKVEVADVTPTGFRCKQHAAGDGGNITTQSYPMGAHLAQGVGGYP